MLSEGRCEENLEDIMWGRGGVEKARGKSRDGESKGKIKLNREKKE